MLKRNYIYNDISLCVLRYSYLFVTSPLIFIYYWVVGVKSLARR